MAETAIVSTGPEPLKELVPYYKNPRKGNIKAIAESLRELGQFKPIVVNRGTATGRPNEVLAGNHTRLAAESLGWPTVDVSWVDVDEETAAKIVLADNRTSDLATYDDDALLDLIGGLENSIGTGYSVEDIAVLLNPAPPAPLGAPGSADYAEVPEEDKYQPQYACTIICESEAHQEAAFIRLTEMGFTVKVVTV